MDCIFNRPACLKEKKLLMALKLSRLESEPDDTTIKERWYEQYSEDIEYFERLPYKWESCCRWIRRMLEKHNVAYIEKAITKQRRVQKSNLNKELKEHDAYVILIKNKKYTKLARYLMIAGEERRTGNYSSLMAYVKSLNQK